MEYCQQWRLTKQGARIIYLHNKISTVLSDTGQVFVAGASLRYYAIIIIYYQFITVYTCHNQGQVMAGSILNTFKHRHDASSRFNIHILRYHNAFEGFQCRPSPLDPCFIRGYFPDTWALLVLGLIFLNLSDL